MDIPRRVYNLINKYGTADPYLLARDLNIHVDTYLLPDNIRGCCTYLLRRRFIGISEKLSEKSQKAVLCHEIGHLRLHGLGTFSCTLSKSRIFYRKEYEANIFALHMLSYSSMFDLDIAQKYLKDKRPEPDIVHRILSEIMD